MSMLVVHLHICTSKAEAQACGMNNHASSLGPYRSPSEGIQSTMNAEQLIVVLSCALFYFVTKTMRSKPMCRRTSFIKFKVFVHSLNKLEGAFCQNRTTKQPQP